jgi:hypothetical protein
MGFADFVRGVTYLYQYAAHYSPPGEKTTILVDYRDHPIGRFLENKLVTEFPATYGHCTPMVWQQWLERENITIQSMNDYQWMVFEYFNHPPVENATTFTQDVKEKTIESFGWKKPFRLYMHHIMNEHFHGGKPFVAIHIRMRDEFFDKDFVPDIPSLDLEMAEYLNGSEHYEIKRGKHNYALATTLQKQKWSPQQVFVLSNSYQVKMHYCRKYNFKCLDVEPIHLGTAPPSKLTDRNVMNTLSEFFLLTKASQIIQFIDSKLTGSGFSYRISQLYNIPFAQNFFEVIEPSTLAPTK